MRRGLIAGLMLVSAALAVLAVLSGAGSSTPSASSTAPPPGRALMLWQRFPVELKRRPIILNGDAVTYTDSGGSQGLSQRFAFDPITLATRLPSRPATANGYRLTSALKAYRTMLADRPRNEVSASETLRVRAVRLGTAKFVTDRGQTRLPAWQFYFRGLAQPVSVLAPVPYPAPSGYDPAEGTSGGEQAVLLEHGRELRISFTGAPAGKQPCDESYTATTAESAHAVVYTIIDHPAVAGPVTCDLVGYPRMVTVYLKRSLGNRVLVSDADGHAIPAAAAWTYIP